MRLWLQHTGEGSRNPADIIPEDDNLATLRQVELGCRVAVLLVRLHRAQLLATPAARPTLLQLHRLLHAQVGRQQRMTDHFTVA